MKTKKLAFVLPRMSWQYDPYSDPPLGLLQVAAHAKKIKGLEVELADLAHDRLEEKEADYYAMGATTLELPEIVRTAEKIREINPRSKILVGGVHFDVLPEDYWKREIENLPFDVICRGEGEATIYLAVDYLQSFSKKRVITQKDGLLNLDNLELPARDLLSKEHYFSPGKTFSNTRKSGEGNSATIMGSRGCPFACSFCASPTLHKRKLRFRGSRSIKKELSDLRRDYNVTDLRWQDDNFPYTLQKSSGLADFLHEQEFRYRASLRTDKRSCNPETLEQLWYSGCREVGFGIESGEQGVLNLNSKGTNLKQNARAIRMAKDNGFLVRIFLMSGLPGETKDSGKRTAEFIEQNWPYLDTVTLTTFVPLPGTAVFREPERYGIKILHKDWEKYNIAITREFQEFPFVHELEGLSREDMTKNLEEIKSVVFRRGLSNVNVYNDSSVGEHYNSPLLEE